MKNFQLLLPTVGKSWIYVLIFFLGNIMMAGVVMILSALFPGVSILTSNSLLYFLSFVPLFLCLYFESKMVAKGNNTPSVAYNKGFSSGQISTPVFILLSILAMLSLALLIEPLSALMPMPESMKMLFESLLQKEELLDTILSVSIMAPILEELFCRGIVLRGISYHRGPVRGILWSALIFAVLHLNPYQGIPAFIIGCFFGWLYYRTSALWITILLHAVNNSISVIFTVLYPDLPVDASFKELIPANLYPFVLILCGAIFVIILLLFNKKLPKQQLLENEK